MGNPVVHFEVIGTDALPLQKFYADLFGWHIQNTPDMGNYGLVDTHAGGGINGAVGEAQEGGAPYVTFYVEVDDTDAALATIESLGGATAMPTMEIPGVVTFAQFTDPKGNLIGLVKGGDEGPGVSPGDGVRVEWWEILTDEPKALLDFYTKAFDWTLKENQGPPQEGFEYHQLDTAGGGISGGIGSSPDGSPHVTIYAQVDDVQKYLEKAGSLGGTVAMPPQDMGTMAFAVLLDPQGNAFGLFSMKQ